MEHVNLNIDTVKDYCDSFGFTPQHPLVAVVDSTESAAAVIPEYTARWGVYALFLKQTKGCTINYGKTTYDYDAGSVVCLAPGQRTHASMTPADAVPRYIGLVFHPDLLFRTSLAPKMRRYTFFGYESREALHLSEEEKADIADCLDRIRKELRHQADRFSKHLIVSNIELMLDYCLRYYSRQFAVREELNAGVMSKLEHLLDDYMHGSNPCADGIPNVKYFAGRLSISPNYFGDLVKRETGRTAQEFIQDKMLHHAKNLLLDGCGNVSRTAYALGFQYPQHFIRFFKRKTGITPKEFISSN